MLGPIQLDAESQVPLYRQLYERIASFIRSGALPNGERIPPTRELASQLGLNRTTVSAAYALLEADGLIRGHVGRGSFVNFEGPPVADDARESRGRREAIVSFASSRPAGDQFPLTAFQQCCRDVISGADAVQILQLGSPAGYAPLRRYLLDESTVQGVAGSGDEVVVTNGCQQALDLIARVLAPSGAAVVIEDPVYHGARKVFERAGARLTPVTVTEDGIDLDLLARVFAAERPALIIVTPEFQNPTGATMGMSARTSLLRLAREFGVVVVENGIYRDLRYRGEALPSLKQLDNEVVLIRSFSKIAFPGLRVGWVVAPSRIAAALAETRQWCDLHTDHLSQAILLQFARSGQLAAHIEKVRATGLLRLDAVLDACERHLPAGSTFTKPDGGMNMWVRLATGLDASELLPHAQRRGVDYVPGSQFCIGQKQPGALRLSFGGLAPERIEAGISAFGAVCREQLNQSGAVERFHAAPALV